MFQKTPLSALIILLLLCAIFPNSIIAQLEINAEIRPRTEYRHGYKVLADSSMQHGLFTDQRSRISVNYKNEKYQVYLSLQDVRTWGSQP